MGQAYPPDTTAVPPTQDRGTPRQERSYLAPRQGRGTPDRTEVTPSYRTGLHPGQEWDTLSPWDMTGVPLVKGNPSTGPQNFGAINQK